MVPVRGGLRHTDRLIGDCGAHVQAEDLRQAEIGFTLAPQHRGPGYAAEAVHRLLHYLLIERGKHGVGATCDDRNTGSAARAGADRHAPRRPPAGEHLVQGEWTNDLLYGVLRREWPSGS